MTHKRAWLWSALALWAAAPLLLWLTGERVYVGNGTDLFSYQIPLRQMAATMLGQGALPVWNPWALGGVPSHVAMQLGLAYPVHWLAVLLPAAHVSTWLLALHLAWLALGTAKMASHLLRPNSTDLRAWAPAALAGAVVAGSGATWGHVYAGHVSLIEAWSWLPWIWALSWDGVEQRRPRPLLWAAAAWGAQLLAGHPQVSYFTGFGLVPLLLWGMLTSTQPVTRWRRLPASVLVGLAVATTAAGGVALAAVQLWPTALATADLNRQLASPSEIAFAYSAPARSLWTALAPRIWGGPGASVVDFPYHEVTAFVGAPALALASVAACCAGRRAWGLAALALVFVALSCGSEGPLLPALVDLVPGIGSFRVPGRWLLPATMVVTLLAAQGLAWLWQPAAPGPSSPRRDRVAGALLGVLALVLAVAASEVRADDGWWHHGAADKPASSGLWAELAADARSVLQVSAAAFAMAALAVVWPTGRRSLAAALALGAVTTTMWHAQLHVGEAMTKPVRDVAWSAEVATNLRTQVGSQHRLATAANLRHANRGGTAAVRVAGAYEPAVSTQANRFGNLLAGRAIDGYAVNFQVRRPNPWLDRLAVSHVLLSTQDSAAQRAFGAWPIATSWQDGLQLRRHPSPMARIEVPESVLVEPDAKAAVARLGSLPSATVLLSEELPRESGAKASWQVRDDAPETVHLSVEAEAPVVLVVRDAWSPGWQATIDGQAARTALCDGLFRAVAVPTGRHELVWSYRCPGLLVGALWSLGALLSGLAVSWWLRKRATL